MEKKSNPSQDGGFNRDDSGAEKNTTKEHRPAAEQPSPFVRDKRPRIRRVTETLNERKPRESTDPPAPKPDEASRRRSFNPNFDENNRRVPSGNRYERNPEEDNRFNSYRYDREQERPRREGYTPRGQQAYVRQDGPRGGDRYGDPNRPRPNRYDGDNRDNRYNRSDRPYSKTDRPGGYDRNSRPGGANRPRQGQDKRKSDPFKTPKGGYDSNFKPKIYPAYAAARIETPIRLNKYISMSGLCSRREADEYIQAGDITVNGKPVTELGVKINPGDEIRYKGEQLQGEKRIYILMNKPKGFVTTLEDPNAERTVMDIVRNACQERVYPVGRLDKNSLGVLLITNDGELTKKLTHPGNEQKKVYQVTLDRAATDEDLEKLYKGIDLEDGTAKVDEIEFLDEKRREVGLSIHSGRNRIVRRMFEELGYHVQKLDRVYFAGLTKKGLRRGAWRYLTPKEVAMLKAGSYE
jgi:23S rRNA pseudouridine2605 synthase